MSREEKERILRTLESDREFRYALMGLLGFREILDRITRLEERIAKLEERQQRLEEWFKELAERQQRLEERFAKLEERFAQLEERFAKLEERVVKLEERVAKLEEMFVKLEERFARLEERYQELANRVAKLEERFIELSERVARVEERLEKLDRTVIVIAHRFGVLSESGFREAMKYVVEEILGVARVERWIYRDEEGLVYGYPSLVEVDLVVRDREHVLIEIKSRVSKGDVAELYRIGRLYEKVRGIKPRLLIVGGFIDPQAYEAAAKLGIEIRPLLKEQPGIEMP